MIKNVIDGKLVEAADGRVSDVVDPSTGKTYDVAALSSAADVDAAYAAATKAFRTWRRTTPSERQQALLALADALEARGDDLVAAEVENTGKPIELTRTEEIVVGLDQLRFFAGAARMLEGAAAGEYLAGHTSYVRREPVGVVGRKAPAIVFADADLPAAVEGIVVGGYFNAGQDCTAATRVLVQAEAAERFQELLVEAVSQVRTGPPSDDEATYGPLNNATQLERVSAVVDRLPEHATVLTGGHRVGTEGYFYAPTVVAGVRQDDAIVQRETFGPVLTLQTFESETEAIELANGVELGLSASVWSTDHGTAHRCSIELDFGCVWVNTHIPLVAEMPHGGFKQSGYGKDLSHYGLEDYTRIKHVMHAHG